MPVKVVGQRKTVNGFIALRPIPERPWGGFLPPSPVLALGRRSGRVPALPYPPPRLSQVTSRHWYRSTSFSLVLARRLASAAANFCLLAVQIASARPPILSAGVM
jgi:hypothetical protein